MMIHIYDGVKIPNQIKATVACSGIIDACMATATSHMAVTGTMTPGLSYRNGSILPALDRAASGA
jgi:hypothetical protein